MKGPRIANWLMGLGFAFQLNVVSEKAYLETARNGREVGVTVR